MSTNRRSTSPTSLSTIARTSLALGTLAAATVVPALAAHGAPIPAGPSHLAPALPAAAPKAFVPAQARPTATLAVRAHATTASARIATFAKGSYLMPVCSVKGQSVAGNRTWVWASDSTHAGWVSARYLKVSGGVPACSSFPGLTLMNATITSPAQVGTKLAGTSASFRSFVAAETKKNLSYRTSQCADLMTVIGWWKPNQAIGYVGGCGGYVAVWTLKNGHWHETGWNGDVSCAELRSAGATHAIPGNTGVYCYVQSGRNYVEQQFTPKP